MKNKLMLQAISILLLFNGVAIGQSTFRINKDTIVFDMQKLNGIGPGGHVSHVIGSLKMYDGDNLHAYPAMKNPPLNLTDITSYCFILNRFQFYYQNYVAGIYTKNYLSEKFKESKHDLADTAKLSRKPLLCYVSALTGFNETKDPVYIVDANNNGDFADDVVKPILKNVYDEDLLINAAVHVKTTYLLNDTILNEELPVLISRPQGDETLSFTFPQYAYTRFKFEGQSYIICADVFQWERPAICIIPDLPRFTNLGPGKMIYQNQIVKIGNSGFTFAGVFGNFNQIKLIGNNIGGFSSNQINAAIAKNTPVTLVNNSRAVQIGFEAPPITGLNINAALKSTLISTDKMRGKYIFIDFWSTTCIPCIGEFKFLKEAYLKFSRNQLEIIGVVDERTPGATIRILKLHNVTWPNIMTNKSGTLIKGYEQIASYPTSYLLDPNGKLIEFNLRGDELMNKLKTIITP
jgi:thiol-disulfide isomerase/thioredoxin